MLSISGVTEFIVIPPFSQEIHTFVLKFTSGETTMKNGLQIEHQEQITIFIIHNNTRDTIQAWADSFRELLIAHEQSGDPYFLLMDVSNPNLAFTTAFRQKAQEVVNAYQHLEGYIAAVFTNRFMATILDFFMRAQRRKKFVFASFVNQQDALQWLHHAFDQTQQRSQLPRSGELPHS